MRLDDPERLPDVEPHHPDSNQSDPECIRPLERMIILFVVSIVPVVIMLVGSRFMPMSLNSGAGQCQPMLRAIWHHTNSRCGGHSRYYFR